MEIEIIKIGGSVLFDHTGKFKREVASSVANLIGQMKSKVIVVIGCGENMHDRVIAANLTDKPQFSQVGIELKMDERTREFFALYNDVEKNLNMFAELNGNKRFKPVHPAHAFVKNSQGSNGNEIVWFDEQIFEDKKLIPLTSGGVISDRRILFSAISSDTIAAFLATQFKASRLVFLTESQGIYQSLDNQTTIPVLSIGDINKYQIIGGMKDKLRRISSVNLDNTQVVISGIEAKFVQELLLMSKVDHATVLKT